MWCSLLLDSSGRRVSQSTPRTTHDHHSCRAISNWKELSPQSSHIKQSFRVWGWTHSESLHQRFVAVGRTNKSSIGTNTFSYWYWRARGPRWGKQSRYENFQSRSPPFYELHLQQRWIYRLNSPSNFVSCTSTYRQHW